MSLDLIIGPMYSGKTSELLRQLFTVAEVGMKALYINHSLDVRNSADVFSSHNPQLKDKLSIGSVKMISAGDLSAVCDVDTYDIIGIDEAQFFSSLDLVHCWVEKMNKRVIVAGLSGDYNRRPFGHVLDLIPHCDTVMKLTAYCMECCKNKKLTQALFTCKIEGKACVSPDSVVDIGGPEKWIAACRSCYNRLS